MIKLGIHYDLPSMTNILTLKKVENGKRYYAKSIEIEWKERSPFENSNPFVVLPEETVIEHFEERKSNYESKYDEIKNNKKEHIENLNLIINKLMENNK